MAYTFQSRATADLIMLQSTAEQILKLLERPLGEPGIFTVEQIPGILAQLDAAVADDDARRQALQDASNSEAPEDASDRAATAAELGAISLRQRVVPLADMLRRSAAEGKAVTWKV